MIDQDVQPDPPLTPEQRAQVECLSTGDVRKIDEALLSNTSHRWCKVAMIVGTTMGDKEERFPEVPDIYYAQRIRHLVEKGILEAQGYLPNMRYAEVRLRSEAETANET